jgi:hypothetical protein
MAANQLRIGRQLPTRKGASVRLIVTMGVGATLALLAACGDQGEGGEVEVTLLEWSVATDVDTLPKGPIEITVENDGELEHELVIIRADIPANDLPTKDDGSIDEDAPGVDVEREIEDIGAGDRTGRTFELDPGSYVFACNIVSDVDGEETSHYANGMAVGFTITEE